jgi:hypothetical protein
MIPAGRLPARRIGNKPSELAGIVDIEQEVVVVRGAHVATATEFVETLGPPEDADDDLVEVPARPEEETALEGPAGDLDQGTRLRDVTELSCHAPIRRKTTPKTCSP